MASSLKDKIVVITGASAGIGESTAHAFAKDGARLIIIARRKERLDQLARELKRTYKTDVLALGLDVSDASDVHEKLHNLPKQFGVPDILVNNAGMVRGLYKTWEVPADAVDEMIDINVKGLLNVTREVLPQMLQENRGHIINIGSIAGHESYPGGSIYCATKFAVRALTDTLRKELVATPIRVSLVSPGMVNTEFSLVRYEGDKSKADAVYRGLEPLIAEDIAEIVVFTANRPPHVNIGDIVVYPKSQASVGIVHRKEYVSNL